MRRQTGTVGSEWILRIEKAERGGGGFYRATDTSYSGNSTTTVEEGLRIIGLETGVSGQSYGVAVVTGSRQSLTPSFANGEPLPRPGRRQTTAAF